ncbi:zinc finger CCHC domain-containing protein 14, partial [Lates japonicus]
FLTLTEEDLNKYDLTQGAKKKLKTQLELQKEMKMEKRSCSGIARVTPSSHMGPSTHPTSTAGELRVEVDAVPHHHPVSTDSSSSSGYSSSSCSPRTPLCCDSTFDRSRDIHRRVSGPDAVGGGPEKDRSCLLILNSSCPTGSKDRTKQVGSGLPAAAAGFSPGLSVGMGVRLENLFPGLNMDGSSALQDSMVCRGLAGECYGTDGRNQFCSDLHSGSQSGSSSGGSGGGFVPSVPVAAVPGNTYYPPQPTSSPSPSPSSASSLDQSLGHTPSVCVCSSCGCRGNCGAYGALPGYAAAGYLQPFSAGLLSSWIFIHLSPLLASSSTAGSGSTPFSYPMMMPPPLYRHSPVSLDQQQSFGFCVASWKWRPRSLGQVAFLLTVVPRTQSRGLQTACGFSTANW